MFGPIHWMVKIQSMDGCFVPWIWRFLSLDFEKLVVGIEAHGRSGATDAVVVVRIDQNEDAMGGRPAAVDVHFLPDPIPTR